MEGTGVNPFAYVSVLVGSWAQLLQCDGLGAAVQPLDSHTRTDTQQGSLEETRTVLYG